MKQHEKQNKEVNDIDSLPVAVNTERNKIIAQAADALADLLFDFITKRVD